MHYDDVQMNEMRDWFLARYEEPVVGTPHEGEHVFLDGGPYDALEVLNLKFDDKYAAHKINKVAEDLTMQCGDWVKRPDFDG